MVNCWIFLAIVSAISTYSSLLKKYFHSQASPLSRTQIWSPFSLIGFSKRRSCKLRKVFIRLIKNYGSYGFDLVVM
jgi:hypothetical protein